MYKNKIRDSNLESKEEVVCEQINDYLEKVRIGSIHMHPYIIHENKLNIKQPKLYKYPKKSHVNIFITWVWKTFSYV